MAAAGTPATRSLKGAASLGVTSTRMGSICLPSTTQRPPPLASAAPAHNTNHAATILIGIIISVLVTVVEIRCVRMLVRQPLVAVRMGVRTFGHDVVVMVVV